MLATVNPGDEVIVFEPAYDAYAPDVAMAGGVVRAVPLAPPDWRFDPDRLAAAFGPRTRALILNTPHNPTGKVFARAELETIAALCRRHDVLVISDEVYAEILFDGAAHVPIATLPEMAERTITIGSMGKTFSVTGWKVGWAIAPAALSAAVRAVHQFVTFTNSAPFQEALADVLPAAAGQRLLRAAARRLRAPPRPARAACCAARASSRCRSAARTSCSPTSASSATRATPTSAARLVTEIGVAAIPTSVFYERPEAAPPVARFCFAKRDETILAARAARLAPPAGHGAPCTVTHATAAGQRTPALATADTGVQSRGGWEKRTPAITRIAPRARGRRHHGSRGAGPAVGRSRTAPAGDRSRRAASTSTSASTR